MIALLLLLQLPVAARADTVKPVHDAIRYDILIAVSDTGAHIVGEVETIWVLGSDAPVVVPLDSAMRVVRVLIDGRENTRVHRTAYGRDGNIVYIPHDKQAGDTLTHPNSLSRHGTRWPGGAQSTPTGQPHLLRRQLARPGPPVAAGAGPPLRQGGGELPGGGAARSRGDRERHPGEGGYAGPEPCRLAVPARRPGFPSSNFVIGAARMAVTPLTPASCSAPCVPADRLGLSAGLGVRGPGLQRRARHRGVFQRASSGPFPIRAWRTCESSTRFGGMENATAIFYADADVRRERNVGEEIIAHETAHQWFGDAVTEADWHHLWLSEGFATYLAALWIGHVAWRQRVPGEDAAACGDGVLPGRRRAPRSRRSTP